MSPNTPSTRRKRRPASDTSGIDAVTDLFARRPAFRKLEGFKGSRETRKPAHYDMHLHPQLILEDIVSFSGMLDQLAQVADSKINAFLSSKGAKNLPRVDKLSILHEERVSKELHKEETWIIGHEITLQSSYPKLQQYPALVASTLIAGLDEWSSIFRYDAKPTVAAACAEADGYLSLNMSAIEKAEIPEELKAKLRLLVDNDLSDFLFWEFKSLNAGTKGVMLAILYLAGSKFPWLRCPVSKHCDSQFCQKKNDRFKFTVTGNKTGVDGGLLENKSGVDTGHSFAFDLSKLDFSVSPVHDTGGWKFKESKLSKKRTRLESDNRHSTDAEDTRDDDDGDGDDDDNEGANADDDTLPFTETEYHKALKIIQQIWAEAVNIDATFIVLNCGNLEYIGIRDRKLQRLYLSPLLDLEHPEPGSPGYFKIHTGLEIVALLDAIERAERLNALPRLPELHTFKYDRSEPYEDKVSSTPKTARPSKTVNTQRAAMKAKTSVNANEDKAEDSPEKDFTPTELHLLQRLKHAHSLKLTWKQNIRGLGSSGSMTLVRTPAWPAHTHIWTEEMEVHIMAKYSTSALSYACYVSDGETAMRGIVVKLACGESEQNDLQREHDMYAKFPEIDGIIDHLGIVKQFGLFQHPSDDKIALVLLDGGESVAGKFGSGRTPANIYLQVCKAVKIMHSLWITHGSLEPENILITKDEESRPGQWVIHLIRWKNGKDHHISTATEKACNDKITRKLERGTEKLKVKYANAGKALQENVTETSLTARRKRCKKSKSEDPRGRLHSVIKRHRQQRKMAIEKDLRRLEDDVWHK